MRRVFKYRIDIAEGQEIWIPSGARVIHVGLDQENSPCIWCEVDTEADPVPVRLSVHGTGCGILPEHGDHLGSFVSVPFVWHVYSPDIRKAGANG